MSEINEKRLRFLKYLQGVYPGIRWVEITGDRSPDNMIRAYRDIGFGIVDGVGYAFWDWDGGEGNAHLIPKEFEGVPITSMGNIGDGLSQFTHWYHQDDPGGLISKRGQVLADEDFKWEVTWECGGRDLKVDIEFTKILDKDVFGLDNCSMITENKSKVTCPRCRGIIEDK